jgi:hypothetical protein
VLEDCLRMLRQLGRWQRAGALGNRIATPGPGRSS